MLSQSKLFVKQTHKTKAWWMFLSVLIFVFVPFLILWLLGGEFNLLNNNWLIAQNASVWHGYVTDKNINELIEKYSIFHQGLEADLNKFLNVDTMASINADVAFFNPVVLAPLFGLLVWALGWPILFNAIKVSGLDILPFSAAIGTFMFTTIISGLIPQWGQSMLAVYWLVRIFMAAILAVVVFLFVNYFTNKYMASRPYATDIFFGYKKIEAENALARQQLKDNLDTFKKQKNQDDSFIEVEEGK